MPIVVDKNLTIRVLDNNGRSICSATIDEKGVRGFSGRLLCEQGDGQRLEVDSLGLLQAVYEAGQRSIERPD